MHFMPMVVPPNIKPNPKQRGVSLFITMSALMVLATLTVTVTAQMMAPTYVAAGAVNTHIHQNRYRSALQILSPVIRVAATSGVDGMVDLPQLDGGSYSLSIEGSSNSYILQDINGLLDVNSASSSLLLAFLAGIGFENEIHRVKTRRAVAPFRNGQEFLQFLEISSESQAHIIHMITVQSGQRRINGQTAPRDLLQILSGINANRAQMIAQIDHRFLRTRQITKVLVRVTDGPS